MADFFKSLQIDKWYKVFIYIGAVLFVIALTLPIHGITNKQLILFSLSLFFIGVGEWKNDKSYSYIKPPNAYTGPAAFISGKIREPDLFGTSLDIIGIILLIFFIFSLFKR